MLFLSPCSANALLLGARLPLIQSQVSLSHFILSSVSLVQLFLVEEVTSPECFFICKVKYLVVTNCTSKHMPL